MRGVEGADACLAAAVLEGVSVSRRGDVSALAGGGQSGRWREAFTRWEPGDRVSEASDSAV